MIFLSSKKEYKESSCPLSLAQRKELKETSTHSKSLPIWRDLNSGLQKTAKPSRVLVTRDYALDYLCN